VRLPLGLENRLWENRGQGSGSNQENSKIRMTNQKARPGQAQMTKLFGNKKFGFGRGDCRASPSLRSGLRLTAMTKGKGLAITRRAGLVS